MLSYHHVCEAIANGMVKFFHIPGEINPADILSKHWGHQQIWKQLQPLLFWKEIRGSCSKRNTARKSTMASLNGETLPTKVAAIEPILGSAKYEARSHYHSVLEEIVYIQELVYMSERSRWINVLVQGNGE